MDKRLIFFLILIIGTIVTSTTVSATLDDGLLFWISMNSTTNSTDDTGNYSINFNAQTSTRGGKVAGGVNYSDAGAMGGGTTIVGFSAPNEEDFTYGGWLYVEDSSDDNGIILHTGNGGYLHTVSIITDNTLRVYGDGCWGTNNIDIGITPNSWQFFTWVHNTTGSYLYVNGTLTGSAGACNTMNTKAHVTRIGSHQQTEAWNMYAGGIDEFFGYSRGISYDEQLELYNSGTGKSYADIFPIVATASLEILLPTNQTIIAQDEFSARYNFTNPNNETVYNITLEVYNTGNSLLETNTTILNDNSTELLGNMTVTMSNYGEMHYRFRGYYNDSGTLTEIYSGNRTFYNGVIFNVVDDAGAIIDDALLQIGAESYNNNPVYYPASSLTDPTDTDLVLNASSASGFYIDNDTTINVNISSSVNYSIVLESYKLLIFFTQGGATYNVSGYITDLNNSYTFENNSYVIPQENLTQDVVFMRFINGDYNLSVPLTWENKSQFYEYDNTIPEQVTETIEIFSNIDTSSYFQTQDNSGNIIKNARLRLFATIPTNTSGTNSSYALYGQRLTDNDGKTVFALDSEAELYIQAVATGYKDQTIRLTASEITTFTEDNPKTIRMEKSDYEQKEGVFIGDLWQVNGTLVYPSQFNDISLDYFLFVYDFYDRSLKYQTSFEGVNRTITKDATTKSGVVYLTSGEQFSDVTNATWYLYIYVDDVLTYTIEISFNQETREIIIDTAGEGLDSNESWTTIVFILLIMISTIIGVLFSTPEGDAGVHVFFIGSFIVAVITTTLGWLAFLGAFYYFGKLIKKWVSE